MNDLIRDLPSELATKKIEAIDDAFWSRPFIGMLKKKVYQQTADAAKQICDTRFDAWKEAPKTQPGAQQAMDRVVERMIEEISEQVRDIKDRYDRVQVQLTGLSPTELGQSSTSGGEWGKRILAGAFSLAPTYYTVTVANSNAQTKGSTLGGAVAGAAAGAVVGSFLPVVGTGIGAVIGGIGGTLAGNKKAASDNRAKDVAATKNDIEVTARVTAASVANRRDELFAAVQEAYLRSLSAPAEELVDGKKSSNWKTHLITFVGRWSFARRQSTRRLPR